jgi:hypothetical protein
MIQDRRWSKRTKTATDLQGGRDPEVRTGADPLKTTLVSPEPQLPPDRDGGGQGEYNGGRGR